MLALDAMLLGGCVNPYTQTYFPEKLATGLAMPAPTGKPPKLIRSEHLRADVQGWVAKGYVVIGHSAFQPPPNAIGRDASKQGIAVGADIVLMKTKDIGMTKEGDSLMMMSTGIDDNGQAILEPPVGAR